MWHCGVAQSRPWTAQQIKLLEQARAQVPAKSATYWEQVCERVFGVGVRVGLLECK